MFQAWGAPARPCVAPPVSSGAGHQPVAHTQVAAGRGGMPEPSLPASPQEPEPAVTGCLLEGAGAPEAGLLPRGGGGAPLLTGKLPGEPRFLQQGQRSSKSTPPAGFLLGGKRGGVTGCRGEGWTGHRGRGMAAPFEAGVDEGLSGAPPPEAGSRAASLRIWVWGTGGRGLHTVGPQSRPVSPSPLPPSPHVDSASLWSLRFVPGPWSANSLVRIRRAKYQQHN